MPSRSFRRERSVYLYYEVYNLKKDEFGHTRYGISYTVEQDVQRRIGPFGALASAFRTLISTGEKEVAVSYERAGTDSWEPIFIELDTAGFKPGLHQVAVTLTDLVSGNQVGREAMFRLE